MQLTIRLAEQRDIRQLTYIDEEYNSYHILSKYLKPPYACLVAQLNNEYFIDNINKIAAFVVLRLEKDHITIITVSTDYYYRRKGIFSKLMDEVKDTSKIFNKKYIEVKIDESDSILKLAFRDAGFLNVGSIVAQTMTKSDTKDEINTKILMRYYPKCIGFSSNRIAKHF